MHPDVHKLFLQFYIAEMSTKHVRSAADLARFKCALRIECRSCGNSTTVNGFDMAKAYGTKTFAGSPAADEVLALRAKGSVAYDPVTAATARLRARALAGERLFI